MNIWETRLRFRPRNSFEALDLGGRLIAERRGFYSALWLLLSLPVWVLLTALFWNHPAWAFFGVWLLKPLYEPGILLPLSQQVFAVAPQSFGVHLKQGYRLFWRPRVLRDLTVYRLSPSRSLNLPVTLLEKVEGKDHARRTGELNRYCGGGAGWLTFFGANFEGILLYSLLGIAMWLWFDNSAQRLMMGPQGSWFSSDNWKYWSETLKNTDLKYYYHLINWLYWLVLGFWGPVYVAAGFTLYLNARTLSEAWDIRLVFRRLKERLGNTLPLAAALFLGAALWSGLPERALAEPLPDDTSIQKAKDKSILKKPFPYLDEKRKWCWRSCERQPDLPDFTHTPPRAKASLGVNVLYVVLMVLGLALLGAILWYWRGSLAYAFAKKEKPTQLFGLEVSPESLPEHLAQEAARLFEHDPRAALSLLYRGMLSQFIHRFDMPIHQSDTEMQVGAKAQRYAPVQAVFAQALTEVWVRAAYGHILPEREEGLRLCAAYRDHFPETAAGRLP